MSEKLKGFKMIRIWVGKNNISVEFAGYKGRMSFSLNRGDDLFDFLHNISFKYIELYHHRILKAEADWEDKKQIDEFDKYLCRFFDL